MADEALLQSLQGHSHGVGVVAFHPTDAGKLLTVGFVNDQRVHVWSLPSSGDAEIVATGRVSRRVHNASWEPDGRWFVTAGDRQIKFWELPSGTKASEEVAHLRSRPAVMLEQHHDDTFCDVVVCRVQPAVPASGPEAAVAALSPSGGSTTLTLAVTTSGMLTAFDDSRLMDRWVPLHTEAAFSVSVSGSTVFVGCSAGVVRAFSLPDLRHLGALPPCPAVGAMPHAGVGLSAPAVPTALSGGVVPAAVAVRASHDGGRVAVVYGDRSLAVWTVPTSKRAAAPADGDGSPSPRPSPRRARRLRSFLHHSGPVWDVAIIADASLTMRPAPADTSGDLDRPAVPEGSFVTASADGTVRLWNINPSVLPPSSRPSTAPSSAAHAAARPTHARPGTSVVTGPAPAAGPAGLCVPARHPMGYETLAVLPLDSAAGDGWSVPEPGSVCARAVATKPFDPERGWQLAGGAGAPRSLAVRQGPMATARPRAGRGPAGRAPRDALVAVGTADGRVVVISLGGLQVLASAKPHDKEVLAVAFSPATGAALATASKDRTVKVLDARSPAAAAPCLTQCASLGHHSAAVTSLAFSFDDCKLVTTSVDGGVGFCKVTVAGRSPVDLVAVSTSAAAPAPGDGISAMPPAIALARAAAAAAQQAASSGAISVKLWRSASQPYGLVFSAAMDATNRHAATVGTDKALHVWALRSGRHLRSHPVEQPEPRRGAGELTKVAIDPSGLFAAVACLDCSVSLIDFYSGRVLARVAAHSEPVTGLAFSADCKRLITVAGDSIVMVWRLASSVTTAMRERSSEIGAARRSALGHRAMRASQALLAGGPPSPTGTRVHNHATPVGVAPAPGLGAPAAAAAAALGPAAATPPAAPSPSQTSDPSAQVSTRQDEHAAPPPGLGPRPETAAGDNRRIRPPPLPSRQVGGTPPHSSAGLRSSSLPSWARHTGTVADAASPSGISAMFSLGDDDDTMLAAAASSPPSSAKKLGIDALAAALGPAPASSAPQPAKPDVPRAWAEPQKPSSDDDSYGDDFEDDGEAHGGDDVTTSDGGSGPGKQRSAVPPLHAPSEPQEAAANSDTTPAPPASARSPGRGPRPGARAAPLSSDDASPATADESTGFAVTLTARHRARAQADDDEAEAAVVPEHSRNRAAAARQSTASQTHDLSSSMVGAEFLSLAGVWRDADSGHAARAQGFGGVQDAVANMRAGLRELGIALDATKVPRRDTGGDAEEGDASSPVELLDHEAEAGSGASVHRRALQYLESPQRRPRQPEAYSRGLIVTAPAVPSPGPGPASSGHDGEACEPASLAAPRAQSAAPRAAHPSAPSAPVAGARRPDPAKVGPLEQASNTEAVSNSELPEVSNGGDLPAAADAEQDNGAAPSSTVSSTDVVEATSALGAAVANVQSLADALGGMEGDRTAAMQRLLAASVRKAIAALNGTHGPPPSRPPQAHAESSLMSSAAVQELLATYSEKLLEAVAARRLSE